jgi:hypothetical protein
MAVGQLRRVIVLVILMAIPLSMIDGLIGIQPLGRFWQETEPRQVTGMTLTRCILGKFLGARVRVRVSCDRDNPVST